MIQLRPYQEKQINEIRNILKTKKRVILQGATGSGKTILFTFMAKNSFEKGNKILILTNRIELLTQAGNSFDKVNLEFDILNAESKKIPESKVIIAMVETLSRRLQNDNFKIWLQTFNLIIVDEAHISCFEKVLKHINENSFLIGATATPYRTGKMIPISENFQTICEGESIENLINTGYLSKAEYYGVNVDLKSVKITAGEFNPNGLEKQYSKQETYKGLIKNYNRLIEVRKAIIFTSSINVSNIVLDELKKIQNTALFYIDGNMGKIDRENVLSNFAKTYPAIIVNCGVLTTGYDCPDIDTVILYRATTSLPLYLQMCGRGSRVTATKKTFRIIDFGQNVQRHGWWHEKREWTLDNLNVPKREGIAPIKLCKQCDAMIPLQAKTCPYCGYVIPEKKVKHEIVDLELLNENFFKQKEFNEAELIPVKDLENIRIVKNYKIGFVLHKLKTIERFNEYAQLRGYKPYWAKINYEMFHKY